APVSYLRVISTPGDPIGQGKEYSHGGEEVAAQANARGGVTVTAGGIGGWTLNCTAPDNRQLEAGEYRGAKRYPFNNDAPGLDFSGHGRGSNVLSGGFVVWEGEVKGNQVGRLAVDF